MLPSIPQDKANHALYGAAIALVAYAAGLIVLPQQAALIGLTASILVGVLKEVADRLANLKAHRAGLLPPHGVEWWDAIATAAGGVVVFVSASLAWWIK